MEHIEKHLQPVVMEAMGEWLQTYVEPRVFGTSTVTASGVPAADLESILASTEEWIGVYRRRVNPHLWAVVLASTVSALEDREVGISVQGEPAVDGVGLNLPGVEVEDVVASATALGVSAATAALVLQMPTWRDVVAEYITLAENKVRMMPEGVYRDVLQNLAAAQMKGEGVFDRAVIVRSALSMEAEGGYERWMTRATRIARTESSNAWNLGIYRAAKIEESITGEVLHKVWLCTLDGRTRDHHIQADGQRVPLDGKFTVGGYQCDHPGDQKLPAEEVINCRCTTIIVGADDPLPTDNDRQTERERSDGTTRNPAAVVSERAARGVTRARDNKTTIRASGQIGGRIMRQNWSGLLAPIGERTGDRRRIADSADIATRELPLPLLWQKATSTGHDTSIIIGKITSVTVEGGAIRATGLMFDSPEALEAAQLIADGVIRPSVDLVDVVAEWRREDQDGAPLQSNSDELPEEELANGVEVMVVTAAKLAGATLVSTPAFEGTFITLGDYAEDTASDADEALVASATPQTLPPLEAFMDPGFTGPTALSVSADGRVSGHLALWGTEHIGIRGVTPPHSKTGYALFHVSTLGTTGGEVSVGRLTVGCGHADQRSGMRQAVHHYDEVGTTWAFVKAGEDKYGIWVSGVVNPAASPEVITAGAAAPLSGDWRSVGGNLELVAALSVNVPGFPVPRSYSAEANRMTTLVAAGIPTPADVGLEARVHRAVDEYLQRQSREKQARAMAARMIATRVLTTMEEL